MCDQSVEQKLGEFKSGQQCIFVSADCCLRAISSEDVSQSYVDGLNDPEVRRYLGQSKRTTQTIESVTSYVSENFADKYSVLFGVFFCQHLIGTVRLHDVSPVSREAYVGIALFNKKFWGKGVGFNALNAVCNLARTKLLLKRVHAVIGSENVASQRIFSRCGFVQSRSEPGLWGFDL